jgi:hypothetical protein
MNLRRFSALFAITATLLTACSFTPFPALDFSVGFEPTAFGFEIDDEGKITVASHVATFSTRTGSIGATITGYRIDYIAASEADKVPGDSTVFASGALNVSMRPGLRCDEGVADETYHCSVTDTNVRYMPGPPATVSNFITLDAPTVQAMLASSQNGDYAHVFFYGYDDLNRFFERGPFEVALVVPVAGE